MKIYKTLLAAVAAVIMILTAAPMAGAQEAMSPYSRFGYGILQNNANAAQRQMGGIGYAMTPGRTINAMNPASYAAMDSLTFLFDMGVDFTALLSEENGTRDTRYGGGLDYITMQFPLARWLGASVGLIPYSSVGYSFGSTMDNGSASRQGYGGLNQLYAGLGANPFKGLYIGFNVSYLFGSTVNDVYVTSSQAQSLFEQVFEIRDWNLQVGLQYKFRLNERNSLTLGAVWSPSKTLLGNAWVTKYDVTSKETPDTVATMKLRNNFSTPETWGGGINWEHDGRIMIEADVTYQPWSKAKFNAVDNFIATRFNDRLQVSLGAQVTPDPRGSYLKRTQYRIGGFYNRDYMKVADNSVRDYGIGVGFGLPVPSSKTIVNLGLEWRHRQATPNALLKEDYFNVTLGINFNELWFYKNKLR